MTEKKTFKNPSLDYIVIEESWGKDSKWGWEVNELEFPEDEWDIEVTFTKKVKPPEVGDYMRNKVGGFFGTVLGVDEVSRYIWVRRDGYSRPETFEDYGLWEHVG